MVQLSEHDQREFEKAQDLLEAGGKENGFVRGLFAGKIDMDHLIPCPQVSGYEKQRLDDLLEKVHRFMRTRVDPDAIDREEAIPKAVIDGLAELGVLGMTVPRIYGGGGYSHQAYCQVLGTIAGYCSSTAVLVGAHQSIGLKALVLNGTEDQKKRYLPALARGEQLAAFSLSEPEVGSDAANVQTHAVLSGDGTHWVLNGQKKYATNGALAGVLTVMAKTPMKIDGVVRDKVTAFIVTPDMPGFSVVSPNRSKCGIRGTWQATLAFEDMLVPRENVLGELGKGLKVALNVLNYGRCTLSAGCVGAAKIALDKAVAHARTRRQFGRPIGDFHLVKEKLAGMAERVYAMEAVTQLSAGLVDRHEEDLMLETAITKLYCSESAWQVVDDALQVLGGEGYMREHGVERMLRDARINRIVEGTTEVMTSFIGLMGMKNVGESMERTLRDAKHPIQNFGRLAEFTRHEWSDVLIGHTFDHTLDEVHPVLRHEATVFAKLVRRFARDVTRQLVRYREGIVDMQLIQQRLANAAIDLYVSAAVMSRLSTQLHAEYGHNAHGQDGLGARVDVMTAKRVCHHAAGRIHGELESLGRAAERDAEVCALADALLAADG